jgi:hypothetical protein
MKSQDFVFAAAMAVTAAAMSLTAAAGLSALPSWESLAAGKAAPSTAKAIYCPATGNRQFSNIHRAWVCGTEVTRGE